MTRLAVGLGAGLAVIALLLGLPAPKRPAPAAAPAGPPSVASVWPGTRSFPIPATFPDGSAYTPAVILDSTSSVGVIASADGQHVDLALVPATGAPRVLQSRSTADGGSFDGITFTADHVYWMYTMSDATGHATVSLWSASRTGDAAGVQLSADVGAPVFYGSQYDVQVIGGQLHWAAARAGEPNETELRAIPVGGGPVGVRVVSGAWALSAWPWLVTAPSASDQSPRLHNVDTGADVPVKAPANKQVTCSPAWCRMIPDNAAQSTETDLIRPDGSDLRVIADATAAAIASDVALRDRFELVMTMVNATGRVAVSNLTLYDIAANRTVEVDAGATNAGARGDFIWWSTGDNETLAWHGLDLRTLR
jgi:hypothetical protein